MKAYRFGNKEDRKPCKTDGCKGTIHAEIKDEICLACLSEGVEPADTEGHDCGDGNCEYCEAVWIAKQGVTKLSRLIKSAGNFGVLRGSEKSQ